MHFSDKMTTIIREFHEYDLKIFTILEIMSYGIEIILIFDIIFSDDFVKRRAAAETGERSKQNIMWDRNRNYRESCTIRLNGFNRKNHLKMRRNERACAVRVQLGKRI